MKSSARLPASSTRPLASSARNGIGPLERKSRSGSLRVFWTDAPPGEHGRELADDPAYRTRPFADPALLDHDHELGALVDEQDRRKQRQRAPSVMLEQEQPAVPDQQIHSPLAILSELADRQAGLALAVQDMRLRHRQNRVSESPLPDPEIVVVHVDEVKLVERLGVDAGGSGRPGSTRSRASWCAGCCHRPARAECSPGAGSSDRDSGCRRRSTARCPERSRTSQSGAARIASGCASRAWTRRSTQPSSRITSLSRNSRRSVLASRIPALRAPQAPRFSPSRTTRTLGNSRARRSRLPSVEPLSTSRISSNRSACPSAAGKDARR